MADQEFKLKVPKEDIVKKESDVLSKMAGVSPLQDILTRTGKARTTRDIMGLRSELAGQELGALEAEKEAAVQKPVQEAQAKGEYLAKEAEQYKGFYDNAQQQLQKLQVPEFKPTQDNLMTLSAMAGLIAVVGNVIGKTGGMSGLSAINSMTAMMKGYQQGRKDLFDREKTQFDKDIQKLKLEQEKLMREFDMAYKKIPYNLAEAKADMEMAIAKSGSQFLRATYDRQGANMVRQRIDEAGKDVKHLEDMATKVGLAAAKQGKPLKEKEVNQITGLESLAQSLDKLKKTFKPEYASLGVLGFGANLEFEAMRRLGTEEGKKAVSWWSKYAQLQAPNRHALFGATLTGNELKNYQEFTAKKSDDPAIVMEQLQNQIDYSLDTANQRRRSYEGAGYRLPEAPPLDFLSTYSTPTPTATPTAPAAPGGGGYQVGQVIEYGGKRYKVTKVYQDDPSNPEVEEVK